MYILAIDTSTRFCSIAISSDKTIIAELNIFYEKTHSELLLPNIKDLLKKVSMPIKKIDFIACSNGPGSFTGLRIGLATAKGISYGRKIPIVPISTLMSLANNIDDDNKLICPLLDAGRRQVYAACYQKDLNLVFSAGLYYIEELSRKLNKTVEFVGPDITKFYNIIKSHIAVDFTFAPIHKRIPRASSLVDIVIKKNIFNKYNYQNISKIKPYYIRKSTAEEKFNKNNNTIDN